MDTILASSRVILRTAKDWSGVFALCFVFAGFRGCSLPWPVPTPKPEPTLAITLPAEVKAQPGIP